MIPNTTDSNPASTVAAGESEGSTKRGRVKLPSPALVTLDGEGSPVVTAPLGKRRKSSAPPPGSATGGPKKPEFHLLLYVAGFNARSATAIANLKAICEEHLKGRYELDVVDIYQQPSLARRAQIVAAPTLIRRLPVPLRRIVGDMSRTDRVLVGLDIIPRV